MHHKKITSLKSCVASTGALTSFILLTYDRSLVLIKSQHIKIMWCNRVIKTVLRISDLAAPSLWYASVSKR